MRKFIKLHERCEVTSDNYEIELGCSREDTIIHWASTKWWFHSSCYWDVWVSSFLLWFIFYHLCTNQYCASLAASLVPSMLVFYYWQHLSIALQCAQAIMILQRAIALGRNFSFLPHVIISAPPSLANLWQMTILFSWVFFVIIDFHFIVMNLLSIRSLLDFVDCLLLFIFWLCLLVFSFALYFC